MSDKNDEYGKILKFPGVEKNKKEDKKEDKKDLKTAFSKKIEKFLFFDDAENSEKNKEKNGNLHKIEFQTEDKSEDKAEDKIKSSTECKTEEKIKIPAQHKTEKKIKNKVDKKNIFFLLIIVFGIYFLYNQNYFMFKSSTLADISKYTAEDFMSELKENEDAFDDINTIQLYGTILKIRENTLFMKAKDKTLQIEMLKNQDLNSLILGKGYKIECNVKIKSEDDITLKNGKIVPSN